MFGNFILDQWDMDVKSAEISRKLGNIGQKKLEAVFFFSNIGQKNNFRVISAFHPKIHFCWKGLES